MTPARLIWASLKHYAAINFAVALGVAAAGAVLTGALLVGDSLRGSLRELALQQAGWVESAMVAPRFFHAGAAEAASGVPVILSRGALGTIPNAPGKQPAQASQITVLGVNAGFWRGDIPVDESFWASNSPAVVVNGALADELGVTEGEEILLRLPTRSQIPRESLLGRRDEGSVLDQTRVRVAGIARAQAMSKWSLAPQVQSPRTAFLPLAFLQSKLGEQGKANAILSQASPPRAVEGLRKALTLDDWGLVVHDPLSRTEALFASLDRNRDGLLSEREMLRRLPTFMIPLADTNHDKSLSRPEVLSYFERYHPYLSVESRQMLLNREAERAALDSAEVLGLRATPTLVYLANKLSLGDRSMAYAIVAAVDPKQTAPLGPFCQEGVVAPTEGEIVLLDWPARPFSPKAGEFVRLDYFEPESEKGLRESRIELRYTGLAPMSGAPLDPNLTPEFPGITDKLTLQSWDPPFPYNNKLVTPADEAFWEAYRTTPKAFIHIEDGKTLWGSRFGNATSVRVSGKDGLVLRELRDLLATTILEQLNLPASGFVFEDVRARAIASSGGSTDFAGLFLGFSCFLIVAALLLVGLLFRLHLEKRAKELGLLLALGIQPSRARELLLIEGGILGVMGSSLGILAGLGYAWAMLAILRSWWPGGLDQLLLRLHVGPESLLLGFLASLAATFLTLWLSCRALSRITPRALIGGETDPIQATAYQEEVPWGMISTGGFFTIAIALLCLGGLTRNVEVRAITFFGGGACLLATGILLFAMWLRSRAEPRERYSKSPTLVRLGIRNASRNRARSLLTAGLLASATFLLFAVEAFRQETPASFMQHGGGSGGFAYIVDLDIPIFQDLTTDKGQEEIGALPADREALKKTKLYSLRVRRGDDASCLNLYQPSQPTIVGIPPSLKQRGGFRFKSTITREERSTNWPWSLLDQPRTEPSVPVFGDAGSVQWILHSGLGKTILITDEHGDLVKTKVAGLLADSFFKSELLMSEESFMSLFPSQEGYNALLVEAPPEAQEEVRVALASVLASRGARIESTWKRVEAYHAIENTYLSTFQALGGLGLLLGAIGLAVVLLRTAYERQAETALLRALGFRERLIGLLTLGESSFLLFVGLGLGGAAALLAVAPHLATDRGSILWARSLGLLALVVCIGLGSGLLALIASLRAPLLASLRRE